MDSTLARGFVVVTASLFVAGVALSWPRSGALPAPCARPSLVDGRLACDGSGAPMAGRAWLVGEKLDLNAATARDLERIAGIGPSLAKRIVEERAARGSFSSVSELDDVKGIGPKMLAKLSALVEVSPPR